MCATRDAYIIIFILPEPQSVRWLVAVYNSRIMQRFPLWDALYEGMWVAVLHGCVCVCVCALYNTRAHIIEYRNKNARFNVYVFF